MRKLAEKELDKDFANYILQEAENKAQDILCKDVSEWSVDDFHFLRGTVDYDKNWEKRRKVLEYLNQRQKVQR